MNTTKRKRSPRSRALIYGIGILFIIAYVLMMDKSVAIIGASGAVMGLISAAMLLAPFSVTYEMILPIPTMVKGWLFFLADIRGLLSENSDGVSHLAHVFGFLSIALLVYFLSTDDKRAVKIGMLINIFSIVTLLLLNHWLAENNYWELVPALPQLQ